MIPAAFRFLLCGLLAGCASLDSQRDYSGDLVIHERAVDPAKLGRTVGEVREALGPDYTVRADEQEPHRTFVVTTREGVELYRLRTAEPGGDGAPVLEIRVTNPVYRTRDGIGPGSTLADVVKVYGTATFTKPAASEEERVSFAKSGSRHHLLAISGPGGATIGDYSNVQTSSDGLLRTTVWREDARVRAVILGEPGADFGGLVIGAAPPARAR